MAIEFPKQYPCPPGTDSGDVADASATGVDAINTKCGACANKYYCNAGTNTAENPPMKCKPGYYCPGGNAFVTMVKE